MKGKKLAIVVLILAGCFYFRSGAFERTAFDNYTPLLRMLKQCTRDFFGYASSSPLLLSEARSRNKLQKSIDGNVPFPCPLNNTRSLKRPSSVHELRPGDIDVIGAMGDSLTAGFGLIAPTLLHIFLENRGISFSGGGQGSWRNFLTLPNILKEFNPNLYGYSVNDSFTFNKGSMFNVAEGFAVSANMPYMAEVLVNRIKKDSRVNFEDDWKMITICIGANDFCSEICYEEDPDSILDKHKQDLAKVLRFLRDNLPRTFVNIIYPPNVETVYRYTNLPPLCYIAHNIECPCIQGLSYRRLLDKYFSIIRKWPDIEDEVANMSEFDTDTFTVVIQPFIKGYVAPTTKEGYTDYTYLSPDCFHASQKTGATVANALWNNLLEPVGNKSLHLTPLFEKFNCPTEEHPYIYTKRNSK